MTVKYRVAKAAAFTAAGALAATAVTGVALATGNSDSSSSSTSSSQVSDHRGPGHGPGRGPGHGPGHGPERGHGDLVHGTFTVKKADGTYAEMAMQHGTVTAVSSTSITVRSDDSFESTYVINDATEVHRDFADATAADLVVGDHVRIEATVADGTSTAVEIMALSEAKKAELDAQAPTTRPAPSARPDAGQRKAHGKGHAKAQGKGKATGKASTRA